MSRGGWGGFFIICKRKDIDNISTYLFFFFFFFQIYSYSKFLLYKFVPLANRRRE